MWNIELTVETPYKFHTIMVNIIKATIIAKEAKSFCFLSMRKIPVRKVRTTITPTVDIELRKTHRYQREEKYNREKLSLP